MIMPERLFLFASALSSKTFAILVTGLSAFFSFVLGEAVTDHVAGAALAGTIGTALAAVFLVVPRIMEQRRKSRESAAKLNSDSIAILMKAHDRDVAFYKDKISALELIVALHVKSKHQAVGEWSAALNAYRILVGQLRSLDQRPEIELHPKTYLEIVGESDQRIESLAAARVAEPSPAYPSAE